ncbi:hypothetical protein [Carboxydothermus pertinax]|uniref:Pyridoxal biosynthesis protein n=1 Tax=Carboxydothermus pertinax TaxID=870242 RepID=A0A1L8CVF3_9THEO|nr:pyridoxal biosynthesis protein [Carboxydothermus pertinax]
MDMTPEQAKITEAAGVCAVMALERGPTDIWVASGVAIMAILRIRTVSFFYVT